ncbi:MAG: hypothetical protein N3G48_07755, partial [Sulfolobales archaeon]|nr:hypothetical protein [Sulfolobales archaeon]
LISKYLDLPLFIQGLRIKYLSDYGKIDTRLRISYTLEELFIGVENRINELRKQKKKEEKSVEDKKIAEENIPEDEDAQEIMGVGQSKPRSLRTFLRLITSISFKDLKELRAFNKVLIGFDYGLHLQNVPLYLKAIEIDSGNAYEEYLINLLEELLKEYADIASDNVLNDLVGVIELYIMELKNNKVTLDHFQESIIGTLRNFVEVNGKNSELIEEPVEQIKETKEKIVEEKKEEKKEEKVEEKVEEKKKEEVKEKKEKKVEKEGQKIKEKKTTTKKKVGIEEKNDIDELFETISQEKPKQQEEKQQEEEEEALYPKIEEEKIGVKEATISESFEETKLKQKVEELKSSYEQIGVKEIEVVIEEGENKHNLAYVTNNGNRIVFNKQNILLALNRMRPNIA